MNGIIIDEDPPKWLAPLAPHADATKESVTVHAKRNTHLHQISRGPRIIDAPTATMTPKSRTLTATKTGGSVA